MDIKTKYNIGDTVLIPVDKKIETICPFCEGKGEKTLEDGTILYCQNCSGEGKIVTRRDENIHAEGIIRNVFVQIKNSQDLDEYDDYYEKIEGTPYHQLIEYYVNVIDDSKYCSLGTYREVQIRTLESMNEVKDVCVK